MDQLPADVSDFSNPSAALAPKPRDTRRSPARVVDTGPEKQAGIAHQLLFHGLKENTRAAMGGEARTS